MENQIEIMKERLKQQSYELKAVQQQESRMRSEVLERTA